MKAIEVKSQSEIKEFLDFPARLYKSDQHWIRPLDQDVEKVFSPDSNKFFRHGECQRWIFVDDQNKTIGRVAAFVNKKGMKSKNKAGQEYRVGGMGFFECVENQKVANFIFDQCVAWVKEKDCNVIEGPINFGERDAWWGLLNDGFDRDPNYNIPYTKQYYISYFEDYGFQDYFKQLTYGRIVFEDLTPKNQEKAERIMSNPKYDFKTLEMKQLDKFTEDFRFIYNKAWVKHAGVGEMSSLQAKTIMKQMKQIIDPKIVFFCYYEGEPAGFFINLPDVNQIIKDFDGKLTLWNKLRFLYKKLSHTNTKLVGMAFGIIPEHQGKGIEAAMAAFGTRIVHHEIKRGYVDYEMNWIGDFNHKMIRVAEGIGTVVKTHVTYRKMLEEDLEFERCPIIK